MTRELLTLNWELLTLNWEQVTGDREQVLGNFTFGYLCRFFSVHLLKSYKLSKAGKQTTPGTEDTEE